MISRNSKSKNARANREMKQGEITIYGDIIHSRDYIREDRAEQLKHETSPHNSFNNADNDNKPNSKEYYS